LYYFYCSIGEIKFVTARPFPHKHPTPHPKRYKWLRISLGFGIGTFLFAGGGLWLAKDSLTYKGVPLGMILNFLSDPLARNAYFDGDRTLLHKRLDELGFERDIKAHYRPQIPNEVELDRYIHQLMYENTGYVGKAYRIGQGGQLVSRNELSPNFQAWIQLAIQLGIAKGHTIENGEIYVDVPNGPAVPYKMLKDIYTLSDLQRLAKP
jgi:hypothetical protein